MQRARDFANARPRTAGLYALFAAGCLVIYYTLKTKPTGQYDYVLTLAAGLQTTAFAVLVCDSSNQVAEGLSEKTLWAFFIAHVARLSTTIWGEGYIPEDNTGDVYLYQILELSGVLCLMCKLLNMTTVRTMHDVGQGLERWSTLGGMVGLAVALGWLTQSTGHEDYFADWSWMFSVWLDSFALAPQVRLLCLNASPHVDEGMLHFAGVTLAASLAFSTFWLRTARDHYERWMADGYHYFAYGITGAGAIRVLLCSTYVYMFVRTTKGPKPAGKGSEYELCAQDDEL